jgi:hypothetical protein
MNGLTLTWVTGAVKGTAAELPFRNFLCGSGSEGQESGLPPVIGPPRS